MPQARRVLGKASELWVQTAAGKDPSIAFSRHTPTLALERLRNDHRPAARRTRVNNPVNKFDQLIWKPDGDLLAHPTMVPIWDEPTAHFIFCGFEDPAERPSRLARKTFSPPARGQRAI